METTSLLLGKVTWARLNELEHTLQPIVLADGIGVNTTGLMARIAKLNWRPHVILFADTGGEKQSTHDYKLLRDEWLKKEGFPPVTTVKYQPKNYKNWPPYYTLEENCLTNGTLPGISFGPASCSVKWKHAPQHAFVKEWLPAKAAWSQGERVIKLIGFDAGPGDRKRTFRADPKDIHLYEYRHPLVEMDMDREACIAEIKSVGLAVPEKSSCFFCQAMKPWEVEALPAERHRRIVRMEARANPRLVTCEGLWRSTVKGNRGGVAHPGSMTDFIIARNLLPMEEVEAIWDSTCEEIINFQQGYAKAKSEGKEAEFVAAHASQDYRGDVLTKPIAA